MEIMLKKLFLIIFTVSALSAFGQKATHYYDEFNKEIDKKTFNRQGNDLKEYLKLRYSNDTIKVEKIEKRIVFGKISRESHALIRQDLETVTHQRLDPNKIIIVNYYPGKDNSRSDIDNNYFVPYRNVIQEYKNVSQFFIYKEAKGLSKNASEIIKWLPDVNMRFTKMFFPLYYSCGSYVIIMPNGDYFVYKGEYMALGIIRILNTMDKNYKP